MPAKAGIGNATGRCTIANQPTKHPDFERNRDPRLSIFRQLSILLVSLRISG
jgi:hypothetical protein